MQVGSLKSKIIFLNMLFGVLLVQASTLAAHSENNAKLLAERAMKDMFAGRYSSAIDNANKSLKQDPRNHEAHWVLGNVFMAQGKRDQAEREIALSLKFKSKLKCADCLKQAKRLEKLVSEQRKRNALMPNHAK